jgi:hypothetical protein
MRRGFQAETKIKPTKENIKDLITEEKRVNINLFQES